MSKKAKALVSAALTALYRKDDSATSDTFQVAFDTSAPMIQAVMGAFADAVFSQMERRDAQKAYHGSKRAMAGLVHGQVDRLLTAKRDHAVRKRVSQFQSSLDGFLDDLASKGNTDPEALRRRFYKKLLTKFSEAGLNTDTLSIDPTPATASMQGSSSMKVTAQIIAANKASLAGTVSRPETTTAAPAAPMPDWLKNQSRKAQQRYFAQNPDSKYNPNRRAKTAAPATAPAVQHKVNTPETQQVIHKALSSPAAQEALKPHSPVRVKAAQNLKEMSKGLDKLKSSDPKGYKDAATMAKRMLADSKPGIGYSIGAYFGHKLMAMGYTALGVGTGMAAGAIMGVPLTDSMTMSVGLGTLFAMPSTLAAYRRLLGYGGKHTQYKNDLTKTTYDQAVKKGHIQESAAVEDDDRLLNALLTAASQTVESGELTPDVLAQYSTLHTATPAATASTRTKTETAAPAAPMPDWLKNMGRKGQQRYFAANPNSRYNPNRVARPAAAPKQGAAPAAAKGGHGAMIAKHITPKNVGAVSSTVRKNASAGAAAATHILDDETKKGTVGALQKIQDGQELDGNDKKSLFKTAMIGAAGAALSGATLVGSALLAPVLMSDPNMVHGTLNHIIDSVKNSGASQNFSDAAEKVTNAAGEYIGKAGHFVSENAKDAAARAEKLLGPDTIQKLKDMKSSAGGAVDDATKWASSGLHDVHQKAHDLYDAHVQPHLDKIAGVAKDTVDQVKDKVDTGVSHVKHALRDAKEAVNPTPPATNEQVKDAIDKSGGAKPDYDAVTQNNTADPKLMDSDAPDNVQRHGGQNHPMSDADYTKKIGEATKDAPGYNDKAPTVTTKGPIDQLGDAAGEAWDSAKKFGSDTLDKGSKALDDVTNAAKEAHEHVKKAASDAITHMHKKATDAINDAGKGGEGMLDSLKKGANQLDSDIKTASKEFGDDLARKGSAAAQGIKKGVSDWMVDKGLKKVDIK